jgi:hypothetical protein
MKQFKDEICLQIYGITLTDAHREKICVCCHKPVVIENLLELDAKEYLISGLCPAGWEKTFPPEEEKQDKCSGYNDLVKHLHS